MTTDSFPRQYARTQRLTLGEPRNIVVSPDGSRILFCRSTSGSDSINSLWVFDVATSTERCIVDAATFGANTDESELERARRERAREGAGGIVSYSCDAEVLAAVFVLQGSLVLVDVVSGDSTDITPNGSSVFDPRLSPCGTQVAYVAGNELHVRRKDGSTVTVARGGGELVSWGRAEFIAAEEMGRQRGHWWSPNGERLVIARVDEAPVDTVWIADPSRPDGEPRAVRYPKAGTPNARVELVIATLDGTHVPITWDDSTFPYLATVTWTNGGLVIGVQSRDQRELRFLSVNPSNGETAMLVSERDDYWVELVPGTPVLASNGTLTWCGERSGVRTLVTSDRSLTPPHLQVRSVIGSSDTHVWISANDLEHPEVLDTYSVALDGSTCERITNGDGVSSSAMSSTTCVTRSATLSATRSRFVVSNAATLQNFAETPLVTPHVSLHRLGPRRIPTAIITPQHRSERPLPVLFDPYGGPHAQRVVAASSAYCASQWFADQGFIVVVADGAGTPGLGTDWERAVANDLAAPVLADQLSVLDQLPSLCPDADLTKVAIRGWSFGGYLAALAVLRAPDRFHAAIAGAPVTDWRLYDTHYTERYLGDPSRDMGPYDSTSLIADAAKLERPLLLIHGLADDNVLSAHTLQLSSALLAHGKPHETLLLSGVSHMTPQEVVAENLLLHQVDFLRRSLHLSEG
ncbi:MAG: DPP IV N-terminal domain-containing protein [Ilumatobacteraceae bacterium]